MREANNKNMPTPIVEAKARRSPKNSEIRPTRGGLIKIPKKLIEAIAATAVLGLSGMHRPTKL